MAVKIRLKRLGKIRSPHYRIVVMDARAKRDGRAPAAIEVRTACQAACPTGVIAFGDKNRPDSAVAKARTDGRSYALLEEIGTRPRTTYLARIGEKRHPKEA